MSAVFKVLPDFIYFNKGHSKNAFATSRKIDPHRDGTVMFGRDLLFELLSFDDGPETAFAAICAHEFAHILQFKFDLITVLNSGRPNVKRSELHADFLAGYFAGLRKLENPNFKAAVFADTKFKFGDFAFSSPNHHGTPDERSAAIVLGFKSAVYGKHNLSSAIQFGINYVRSIT